LGSFSSRIPSSTFDIFQPEKKKIHGEKNDTSSSGSSNGGGYYQLF
jgi:hypothetical protein